MIAIVTAAFIKGVCVVIFLKAIGMGADRFALWLAVITLTIMVNI